MSKGQEENGLFYFPMGDQAIVAQFEYVVSIDVSEKVKVFSEIIIQQNIEGVLDLLQAFNNLTICYNPMDISYEELLHILMKLDKQISESRIVTKETIYIPVTFGGSHGEDLLEVAKTAKMTPEETIHSLTKKPYYVYMIGFIAGYPYCGNIDERLRMSRRENPRPIVKKGTVQVANEQIGIMTMDAPSGWHHVGWTPMELFNPYQMPPGLLSPSNQVQFIRIESDEADFWCGDKQKEWDRKWNV